VAPEGEVVRAQASETVPVNELDGVTVMVEEPEEPGGTGLGLRAELARVKEELPLPPLGACQKSPHAARSGAAASNNFAQLAIFIAAPRFLPDESFSRVTPQIAFCRAAGLDTNLRRMDPV
jgi:hypothetical protein